MKKKEKKNKREGEKENLNEETDVLRSDINLSFLNFSILH